MILEPCYCNWDIRGVEQLPAHHHFQRFEGEPGNGRLVPDVSIWVDWKKVAKELTLHRVTWNELPSDCVCSLGWRIETGWPEDAA
jgi:hypothetical protein